LLIEPALGVDISRVPPISLSPPHPQSGPSTRPEPRQLPLTIDTVLIEPQTAVVSLEGDLDLWTAPELKRALCRLLADGCRRLILELAAVRFMDSTALGVLVAVGRRLADDERLVLAQPGPEVLRVLELTGVAGALEIFPTLESALTAIGSAAHQPPQPAALPLTADAALLLGIASTAMPFAQSLEEQAERWLRALRRHGEAGALLASLGVREAPVSRLDAQGEPARLGEADPVAIVREHASSVAAARRMSRVTTTDVLIAVNDVYGRTFASVLAQHGVASAELTERLERAAEPEPAELTP